MYINRAYIHIFLLFEVTILSFFQRPGVFTHTQKPEAFCDLFIYIIFLENQLEKSTNDCISDTQL